VNSYPYFTEIEDRFAQRRGSLLMLSTLDWALIETWREAGIPLEAVLRGIDDAFDKHDAKRARAGARVRKVNGLAWCAQAVMEAAQSLADAAIGLHDGAKPTPAETGLEHERVAGFLRANAAALRAAALPEAAQEAATHTALRLDELAESIQDMQLDALDRTLTVLEERMVAAVQNAAPEAEIVALRAEAEAALAPYRSRMKTEQLRQVQQQFLLKRLLEKYALPRLSLFYMSVGA
jgi:hypothetical protein